MMWRNGSSEGEGSFIAIQDGLSEVLSRARVWEEHGVLYCSRIEALAPVARMSWTHFQLHQHLEDTWVCGFLDA